MMKILLTNDDGIYSEGIYSLWEKLREIGSVDVVAPDSEQSAVGHGITMAEPLRVKKAFRKGTFFGHAVNGTPADCVKIAVMRVLKKRPDIVVSGINLGPNVGFSVLYSGTVSGATEGAILGIPAIAVSLGAYNPDADFSAAAIIARDIALDYSKFKLPKGSFININVPALPYKKLKGIRVCRQGRSPIIERFDKRTDPRGRTYYWLTGESLNLRREANSDITAVRSGYVSVTPLKYDLTDYSSMKRLPRKLKAL